MHDLKTTAQHIAKLIRVANRLGIAQTWRRELGQFFSQVRIAKGLTRKEVLQRLPRHYASGRAYLHAIEAGIHLAPEIYVTLAMILVRPGSAEARQLEGIARRLTRALIKELKG